VAARNLVSTLDEGEPSTSGPGRFITRQKYTLMPIEYESGRATETMESVPALCWTLSMVLI
jgi:hypothetical protein